MTAYLGLSAIGWHLMLENWWDKTLAIIALVSLILAIVYVVVVVYLHLRKLLRARRARLPSGPLPGVTEFLEGLSADIQSLCPQQRSTETPKSFGVFLGSFSNPPWEFRSPNQTRLLTQWELIVLDPCQPGVLQAAAESTSTHVLGRLNVADIAESHRSSNKDDVTQCLLGIFERLTKAFTRPTWHKSPFTGILLADWQAHMPPATLNVLVKYLNGIKVDVYLEIAPPDFLTDTECLKLQLELVKGIICRNGTILPNGDRRNYFQMTEMRRAQRAFAKHAWAGASTLMMWETVDDEVELSYSVVKRSYNWSRFNTTPSWIGSRAGLTDAEVAAERTIPGEPLGALMWLKRNEIMEAHKTWRLNEQVVQDSNDNTIAYEALESIIPNLSERLELMQPGRSNASTTTISISHVYNPTSFDSTSDENPFSISSTGESYTGLGCFQIGLSCTSVDYDGLVEGQRRLRDLDLLEQLKPEELRKMGDKLSSLNNVHRTRASVSPASLAITDLLDILAKATGYSGDHLRVYIGLQSGFHIGSSMQYWGLYDYDSHSSRTDIYLSAKAIDRESTLLHTFLSSRQIDRFHCLMAECDLASSTGNLAEPWALPRRIVHDLDNLSPTESLLLVRRLKLSRCLESHAISAKVRACCEYQLIEVPTVNQLRTLSTSAYLRGEITAEELVEARLAWAREQGAPVPDLSAAVSVFKEFDTRLPHILMNRQAQHLDQLGDVLQTVLGRIDAGADILALSVFCAFRKLAVDEVYLEILDRNPLPNAHPDQAACFAEMFALGSQCEAYLDMTSNALGRILTDRYYAYYRKYQPPHRDDKTTELPTAYASMNTDEDPAPEREALPLHYQITFLGIFAVPALIDILLLTTIGRGLYLSTYMADIEKKMATAGLMASLLLVGAIGTWIGHGGSYYLHSMAFPAMNMFVLTRYIAGIALGLVIGFFSFIIIGSVRSFYAGFIFFFYFGALSSYLTMLATLAIYQLPGFMFQSGRTTVVMCIPILLISPIVTMWAGHDIVVYPCILAVFLTTLVFGARRVFAQWHDWYLKVPTVSDTELVQWYEKTQDKSSTESLRAAGVHDLAATPLPRSALMNELAKELKRRPWEKSAVDKLVKKLADGHKATMFLMDWYCKYSRTKMPYPYSPTWNLQCKAGIDTLKDMQKGLKLHNAFIHWRQGGDEVWCGVLYFVVALMDKWVALLTGNALVGLSAADSSKYRLAVGFGLAYYLIAAVCLDAVATPLWPLANKKTNQPITSLPFLHEAVANDGRARRNLYWRNFAKFFFMHAWGLCVASAMLWTFEESRNAVIMFMCYVGAYTGLLCYQYNRIYTGPLAMGGLITAGIVGLVAGLVLHSVTRFEFASVTALAIATWMSAFLSMRTAKIGWPRFKVRKKPHARPYIFHSCGTLGPYFEFSQRTISDTFDAALELPQEQRFSVVPSAYPGIQVIQLLTSNIGTKIPETVRAAFPSADQYMQESAELWKAGKILLEIVPARQVLKGGQQMRSVCRDDGDVLHIMLLFTNDLTVGKRMVDIGKDCHVMAEGILQATAVARLGLSYDHSILVEMCLASGIHGKVSIPESVKRQLDWSTSERARMLRFGERDLIRYLALGLDCDTEWDLLPKSIRSNLLKRCYGYYCDTSSGDFDGIVERLCASGTLAEQHVARCNLGVTLAAFMVSYAKETQLDLDYHGGLEPNDFDCDEVLDQAQALLGDGSTASLRKKLLKDSSTAALYEKLLRPFQRALQGFRLTVKFLVASIVADPEFQRELDYVLNNRTFAIRWAARVGFSASWNLCKTLQRCIIPWFLFHKRDKVRSLYKEMKGTEIVIGKKRVVIESLVGTSTGFFQEQDGDVLLHLYSGRHVTQPEGQQQLKSISTYTDGLVLRRKELRVNQSITNVFEYEYPRNVKASKLRLPSQRYCVRGEMAGQTIQYDDRGYITSGSYFKDGNRVDFKFWYRKNAKFDDELLRAEFTLAHISMKVSWSVPPPKHPEKLDTWLPYTKVTEATFTQGEDVYHSKWFYDHRSHPTIQTSRNGLPTEAPPMIVHDWFGILEKPAHCSFVADNPLLSFKSMSTNFALRALRLNKKRYLVSTSLARTHLWRAWKGSKEFDAITTRWLDEMSLRSERMLGPYWTYRDLGMLKSAAKYLESQADAVMARTDIDPDVSAWSSLAYKYADLMSFGQGGDSRINTRSLATQMEDSDEVLHVLAMDTGTWPNEGGGVSACRRDMVNDLQTIRWHVLAENANDFGVPKFQIEKNVQSLSVLPLWGLDFLTPIHGIFEDYLDSAAQQRSLNTKDRDIKKHFFPILTSLVKCARAIKFDRTHIEESSQALLDLNSYFEAGRHWSEVWNSDVVKEKWRELWLSEDVENARPISEWLDAEFPTFLHLDNALDMWHRYLFIFSIPVPERIPDVFQASHHFAGASYGVLCKLKRGCTLHVWDHCISWREVTVFLSSAMSFDAPFVCTSLIQLSRMTSTLILHHSDVILPCADFFNPGWEVEHGTQEGVLQHRRTFARKIDPVVNGICNMESFKPIEKIKSDVPTVTMLSHVRFVKDIKNAILAADIIVNEWGFTKYQLDIYGDMEKAPAYSVECKEILASKGLRDHVSLRGLGSPSKVLEESWLFLNSSISEGLPLAMGEAALTGVPVVCTDVGASFRVVTDPVTWKKFSAVVAPNDSYSLAKAQIEVLALLDEWSEFADDEPGYRPKLSLSPTADEVKSITARMYEKTAQRRRLGMMGRTNVLSSFSSDRYLREHEQMLWIGKGQSVRYLARSKQTAATISEKGPSALHRFWRESPSPRFSARSSGRLTPTGRMSPSPLLWETRVASTERSASPLFFERKSGIVNSTECSSSVDAAEF